MLEQEEIFSRFPNIKLSYEHITHKKVHAFNYMIAMPEGIKAFAWFSVYKDKRVCYILEKKQVYIVNVMASSQLNYGIGTIFYGTVLTSTSFCIEEIYYYKGKPIKNYGFIDKLALYKNIFKHDIGHPEGDNLGFMRFGLPVMERKSTMSNVGYNISYIKYICDNTIINSTVLSSETVEKRQSQEVVFNVKPHIQNDIYMLHTYHNSKDDHYYDLAYIPTYTTSVMMNSIFRNIKENANLDKLEESDSEEEFENDNIDKFVYLDKSCYMVCVYNAKFKKWVPIKIAEKGAKVISQREMEKNKY